MKNSQVDSVLDSICGRGCSYVNKVLNDKQVQQGCSELLQLNRSDQNAVIAELKSVMSVYDQTGSCGV